MSPNPPPKKAEVVSVPNQVVVDRRAFEELVRAAADAPGLVTQARAALAGAPPVSAPASGVGAVIAQEPSERQWSDFEYGIGIPGRTPPQRHTGAVWTGAGMPPGAESISDAQLDAFVASLGLGAKGRRR